MDYFTDVLAMFLDLDRCCLWKDQRALGSHQKYPNLFSEDERVLRVWNDMRASN